MAGSAPTYGELSRTVVSLLAEQEKERAEFWLVVSRLEKRVELLEQENKTLRSRLDTTSQKPQPTQVGS